MEKRREFHEKLKEFIASENMQSARAARITLNERLFALFDMYSVDGKIGFDYEVRNNITSSCSTIYLHGKR